MHLSGLRPCFLLAFAAPLVERASGRAPPGPWDQFNYAPASKTVYPKRIHSTHGTISNPDALTVDPRVSVANNGGDEHQSVTGSNEAIPMAGGGVATLAGGGSWVALDFGVEVGGLISMNFNSLLSSSPSSPATLSFSFTESPLFIRPSASDDSSYPSANQTYDGLMKVTVPLSLNSTGKNLWWRQDASWLRGGFRYLTLVLEGNDKGMQLGISNVTCSISFMPHVPDLRAYSGYFYAQQTVQPGANKDSGYGDPDFLTKLWYAGAYTVQTNTVPLDTGRKVPFAPAGTWQNNAHLGVAGPIIVDGAKRDRAVWPGDMGIAVPAQFVSTNDLVSTRNALSTMFAAINPNGALPESGPPLSQQGSDTYHAWTLIGTYNYYVYTGDEQWLRSVWTNYTRAVTFLQNKVDTKNGLMNVTGLRDWARLGGGGYNSEGNALLYQVLVTASSLATHLSLPALSNTYLSASLALKKAFIGNFWSPSLGMFRDNLTTTLCPQDANSLAVLFGLVSDDNDETATAMKKSVSDGLAKNWGQLGPEAPELPDTISPFIAGFELQAHFLAGEEERALDLLRRTWGYMLYTNVSVQSTLLEGFTVNGSIGYRSYRGYNYDSAYTSHAHGWSAGPTSALTFFVLGLKVKDVVGRKWEVEPHLGIALVGDSQGAGWAGAEAGMGPGAIPAAQGGFETPLGWFGVDWKYTKEAAAAMANESTAATPMVGVQHRFDISISTPTESEGVFRLPVKLREMMRGAVNAPTAAEGGALAQGDWSERAGVWINGEGQGDVAAGGWKDGWKISGTGGLSTRLEGQRVTEVVVRIPALEF